MDTKARTIRESVAGLPEVEARGALSDLLETATRPAFGVLTKRELELSLVDALVTVGYLDAAPTVYELSQRLRMSKSRARTLLYERDLRRQTPEMLDARVRQLLSEPRLQNQGYSVALDVDNPVVADHIREKLRTLGHTSDGSFSPSLIRLSGDAAAALVESLVPEGARSQVLDALHKAGVPDKSLKVAIRAVITKAASRVADQAGEAIAGDVVDYLGPMFATKSRNLIDAVRPLFQASSRRIAAAAD